MVPNGLGIIDASSNGRVELSNHYSDEAGVEPPPMSAQRLEQLLRATS